MTNFACASPIKILKVSGDISGDARFTFFNYATEVNRQTRDGFIANLTFLPNNIPVSALEEIVKHPESNLCHHLAGSSAKVNATTTSTQK